MSDADKTADAPGPLEDALQLSSDWIEIRAAARIGIEHQADISAGGMTDEDRRLLKLIDGWTPGMPPARPGGALIVTSVPVEDDDSHHVVSLEVFNTVGGHSAMQTHVHTIPFSVVVKPTQGVIK